ncbi:hypothetical protein FS837_003230, partial [Tulasnella sp. UAMH 9824]
TRTSTSLRGAGSVPWQSPELLRDAARRTFQSDVYAFGITIYEVLSGKEPYSHHTGLVSIITGVLFEGERPPMEPPSGPDGNTYSKFWKEAERCWTDDPIKRPSMFDVLRSLDHRRAESFITARQVDLEAKLQGLDIGSPVSESSLEIQNRASAETASENYQSLVLWARRIRERIIAIENSRSEITRLSPDLLLEVLVHDIKTHFASPSGAGYNMWQRREDLRRVMRRWRDAIDSSPIFWQWTFLISTRNDVLRCLRNNPSEPITLSIMLGVAHKLFWSQDKAMQKAVQALTGAVNRIQSIYIYSQLPHMIPEVVRFLSLPMPALCHLFASLSTAQSVAIPLGEGAPLKFLTLNGAVKLPWESSRLLGLQSLSIDFPKGHSPNSNELLRIMESTVLKDIKISRVDLGGLAAASKFRSRPNCVFPDPAHRRSYFSNDLLPKFSNSQSQSYPVVTLNDVRIPLSDPKTDGTLVWKLLRMPSLEQPSCIAIQVDYAFERGEEQAIIFERTIDGMRRIQISLELKESSTLIQFLNVGLMERPDLPITGIWCRTYELDFTPILHWLLAPQAFIRDGGRLCPFLGNLEFYRCDDAPEELLDKLERRILDFDEERSREPLGQRKFNLWEGVHINSATSILRRAVLRDHLKRWDKLTEAVPVPSRSGEIAA